MNFICVSSAIRSQRHNEIPQASHILLSTATFLTLVGLTIREGHKVMGNSAFQNQVIEASDHAI